MVSQGSLVRYPNPRQIRTLAQLEASGWELTNDIPKGVCCSDTVDASRLPSPFSSREWGDRWRTLFHITETHVPEQARNLYLILNPNSDEYEHCYESEICEGLENGCIGFVGELQEDQEVKVTPFPLGDRLSMVLTPLSKSNATSSQGVKYVGAVFESRRCHNQKTGEFSIFICNKQQNRVIVNESVSGTESLGGPLPDFAIIEFAGHILFWWGSRQGVHYIPNAEPQHMEQDVDDVKSV